MKKTVLLIGNHYDNMFSLLPLNVLKNYTIILSKSNPTEVNNELLNYDTFKTNIISNKHELMACLIDLNPDVIISIGWRRILEKDFFDKFENKLLVNIHPAILPQYKGFHSEPYVIFNNEKYHGITAHVLTSELDAGHIILQEVFEITKFSTVKSIKYEVEMRIPSFLEKLVTKINSDEIEFQTQKGETKIIAPKRKPEDSEINSHESLDSLFDIIRAFDPDKYPAYFFVNGEKVFIRLWTERENKVKFEI